MIDWAGYAALSRRLSTELRDDAAWRDEVRDAHGQARDGLDGMHDRLAGQRERLLALSREVGGHAPDLRAAAGDGNGDPAASAVAAEAAMDRADEALDRADWWAGRPRLLPGMSIPGRAVVVTGGAAAVAFLLSFTMFAAQAAQSRASVGDVLLTVIALPVLAYVVSILVLYTAGRPRRPDPDTPALSNPVLGLFLSYGVMVSGWLIFVAIVAAVT
jgi:hypothetical protein